MALPEAFIDNVLDRVDIVNVISNRVKLKKQGKEHVGCCPFHDEKTPSFTVNSNKQFFKCFGCGAGGDAIEFLRQSDGLDFIDAMKVLAADAGLEFPQMGEQVPVDPEQKQAPDILLAAEKHYITARKNAGAVNHYLQDRGLSADTIERFRLGYARGDLKNSLLGTYPESAMFKAGLLGVNDDRPGDYYDFFRERLVFPVRDHRGKLVGFGGRNLNAGNARAAKYMNPRASHVFDKQQVLFGLYEAIQYTEVKNLDRLIAVEGYMDVVALHEHGITNAVACMGTAFCAAHLKRCFSHVDEVVFCFDGDAAGRNASRKVLAELAPYLAEGKAASFVMLPATGNKKPGTDVDEYHDPDSFVKAHGAEAFNEALDNALEIDEAVVLLAKDGIRKPDSISGKSKLLANAIELLSVFPESPVRVLIVKSVAKALGLTVKELNLPRTPSVVGASKKGGEGVLLSPKFMNQFALIKGRMHVFDDDTKLVMTKAEFVAQVGKVRAAAWYESPVKKQIDERTAWGFDKNSPFERFVYLSVTDEAWDKLKSERVQLKSLKNELADKYTYWFNSEAREQIDVENLLWDPTGEYDGVEGYINRFKGLPLEPSDSEEAKANQYELAKPFIQLLFDLCNKDKDAFTWMVKWLAYPLQNPGAKMDTALLVHSELQGTGKSFFFGRVMGSIYGEYALEAGQEQLESKFNSYLSGKLYIFFEEVAANGDKSHVKNLVKHLVTGDSFVIERKFSDAAPERNYVNLVFLSNDDIPFFIDSDDRRLFVMQPGIKRSDAYYAKVLGPLLGTEAVNVFYRWLLDYDLGDFNERTKPPVNSYKQRLIDYVQPSWELFLDEWRNGELDVPYDYCLSAELYDLYRHWSKKNGFSAINNKMFSLNLGKRGFIKQRFAYKDIREHNVERQGTFFLIPDDLIEDSIGELSVIEWATKKINAFRVAIQQRVSLDNQVFSAVAS